MDNHGFCTEPFPKLCENCLATPNSDIENDRSETAVM